MADPNPSSPYTSWGQIAYEAYCDKAGWKSLATGAALPRWPALPVAIQEAWEAAAACVRNHPSSA